MTPQKNASVAAPLTQDQPGIAYLVGSKTAPIRDRSQNGQQLARFWPESGVTSPIPALDGLRAVAALLVVLFHGWWATPWMGATSISAESYAINYARTGVHLFFVLSGFLLFLPYARWASGHGVRPSARMFYLRRLLRVGPAYWFCLGILILSASQAYVTVPGVVDVGLHAAFLSNLRTPSAYSINGVFWTMAVEVQFYAMLPLLAVLLAGIARRIGLLGAGVLSYAALLTVSLFVGLLEHHGHVSSPFLVGETALPHWLDVFGDGILAAVVYTEIHRRRRTVPRWLSTGLFVFGLALALAVAFEPRLHILPIKGIVFGWAYAAILLGIVWGAPLTNRIMASSPLRFVGLISYSLYLWHAEVEGFVVARIHSGTAAERILSASIVTVVLAVPVAYLSFQITERPFLAARRRTHRVPAEDMTNNRRSG